jgi:hypothetical protein
MHTTFGSKLLHSLMLELKSLVYRTATSPCLYLNLRLIKKRTTLKGLAPKLLGLLSQASQSCLNPLLFVLHLKRLCTPHLQNGSTVIVTCPYFWINGLMLWDGNLNILLLSLEQESSFGKKATLPTQLLRNRAFSYIKSLMNMLQSTKSSLPSPLLRDVNLRMKDLQVLITQQLLNYMSP